ncbi:integration host factor subunit alpha [Legionella tunisiensis]|uniref:integration host factor subunit alpha n=1 Tax=Legionella tunisiensis TaxID=1034944 RepID=UPI0002D80847|nr:integration host factor subunit alpha [Legionella tunisiensis]
MNALSKAVIAETLCDELKLARPDAKEMVEEFYETLRHALENGQHVKLSGFGNFTLRDKPQRPGRNPKTGEEIPVVARRVVTFKPGLKLKTKIEERGK